MSLNIFILGFTDEMVKLAQKKPEGYFSPKAVQKRLGSGPMGPPEPPEMGLRPAPGTRMPKPVYPEKTWKPRKRQSAPMTGIPKAEGIVPNTYVRGMKLPSGARVGGKGIISAVGERKKWEKKVRSTLPIELTDAMKRPVKGHPMATPEAVARSKRDDAEAKKLVDKYKKKKPVTAVARRKRKPKPAPAAPPVRGKPLLDAGGAVLGAAGKLHRAGESAAGAIDRLRRGIRLPTPHEPLPGGGSRKSYVRKPMTVPGYRAVAKKRTI